MDTRLEPDVGFLHVQAGRQNAEQPPGFLVSDAPPRAARGRGRDTLLVRLHLRIDASSPTNILQSLLQLAHRQFFGTPGSLTSAARTAISAVNDKLIALGDYDTGINHIQDGITCAVLRGSELYLVQTGSGTAFTVRSNGTEQFPDQSRRILQLGSISDPDIHYFHNSVAAGDWLFMCHETPPSWRQDGLRSVYSMSAETTVQRLIDISGNQAVALLCRFDRPGIKPRVAASLQPTDIVQVTSTARQLSPSPTTDELFDLLEVAKLPIDPGEDTDSHSQSADGVTYEDHYTDTPPVDHVPLDPKDTQSGDLDTVSASTLASEKNTLEADISHPLQSDTIPDSSRSSVHSPSEGTPEFTVDKHIGRSRAAGYRMRSVFSGWMHKVAVWFVDLPLIRTRSRIELGLRALQRSVSNAIIHSIARLMPSSPFAQIEGRMPDRLLFAVAVAVPTIVVLMVTIMYMQLGRSKQLALYLEVAREEVTQARTAPDARAAETHWRAATDWLGEAESIRPGHDETNALLEEAHSALDSLDGIVRVEVESLIPGGFHPSAEITRLVSHGNNIYALDFAHQTVYRAVLTTAGEYQIDQNFQCLGGPVAGYTINRIVDIAWLDTRNIVGQDALLGFDPSGTLLYCPPDGSPSAATMLSPPTNGWIHPVAIEIYADRLYILEPEENEIWIYRGDTQSFAGPPERYFGELSLDLHDAVDFAIAQRDILILHSDGRLTRCSRHDPQDSPDCTVGAKYTDLRPGRTAGDRLIDLVDPVSIDYNPPPEPSVYIVDSGSQGSFQISLGMVFQRQFRTGLDIPDPLRAFAVGPGRKLFFAMGHNVYIGQLR